MHSKGAHSDEASYSGLPWQQRRSLVVLMTSLCRSTTLDAQPLSTLSKPLLFEWEGSERSPFHPKFGFEVMHCQVPARVHHPRLHAHGHLTLRRGLGFGVKGLGGFHQGFGVQDSEVLNPSAPQCQILFFPHCWASNPEPLPTVNPKC